MRPFERSDSNKVRVGTRILYGKRGCPYCAAAMRHLDKHKIAYGKIDVRGDKAAIEKLEKVSDQARRPTLVWNGDMLADFGIDEVEEFLAARRD